MIESNIDAESVKLNLMLNARFTDVHFAQLLLHQKPKIITQRFHPCKPFQAQTTIFDNKVKAAWGDLFAGIIKKFQKDYDVYVPSVVSSCIKKYVKVGAADFYFFTDMQTTYLAWFSESEFWFKCGNKLGHMKFYWGVERVYRHDVS